MMCPALATAGKTDSLFFAWLSTIAGKEQTKSSMKNAATSDFLIVQSSNFLNSLITRGIAHAAFSKQAFTEMARRLVTEAERALARRDMHALGEVTEIL